MPTANSQDGVSIHYETIGAGEPILIFLHGWGGSAQSWKDVLPHLDLTRFRVVCLDLRGHGKSSLADHGYTFEQFSEDVLAVADKLGAKTFIPVGFSMGGKLACYMAARYGERIQAQILVAPAPPGVVPIDRGEVTQFCRQANDACKVKDAFGSWFGASASPGVVDTACEAIARTPAATLELTAEMTLWTSLENVVHELTLPTSLIVGSDDPVYGEGFQRQNLMPFLANGTITTAPGGHFIPIECPRVVAALINDVVSAQVMKRK